jgi:hypothetical protein
METPNKGKYYLLALRVYTMLGGFHFFLVKTQILHVSSKCVNQCWADITFFLVKTFKVFSLVLKIKFEGIPKMC